MSPGDGGAIFRTLGTLVNRGPNLRRQIRTHAYEMRSRLGKWRIRQSNSCQRGFLEYSRHFETTRKVKPLTNPSPTDYPFDLVQSPKTCLSISNMPLINLSARLYIPPLLVACMPGAWSLYLDFISVQQICIYKAIRSKKFFIGILIHLSKSMQRLLVDQKHLILTRIEQNVFGFTYQVVSK